MYNHQLDAFLSVCQHGSFTAAARHSFITPSAIIQQISLLEKSIGVKLFLRTHHGVVLTPAGEILRKQAPELIHHARDIVDQMKKHADHRPIRLCWATGIEDSRLLAECLSLREQREGMEINLTRISSNVIEGMRQNEFDLCQYVEPSQVQNSYVFTPLYTSSQCVVLPPGHPCEHLRSVSLQDLCGMDLVLLAPGVLADHDAFRELVRRSALPIHLIEVPDYDIQVCSLCYNRQLPFLGLMSLRSQYASLTCSPVSWDIPVHVGLLSRTPGWEDLDWLVRSLKSRLNAPPQPVPV